MSVEATVEKLMRQRINEEAINIERIHFYKTDKSVDPRRENPFKYMPGKLPILVCAPHSVRYIRQKKIKKSDEYTGSIIFLLNQLIDCQALAVTKLFGGDPNFDDPCHFKTYLTQICRENKVKLILDIHGASREQNFDIAFSSAVVNSWNQEKVLEPLINSFSEGGITKILTENAKELNANTIINFSSVSLEIPGIHLEINRKYRVPAQNPQGFNRLIACLAEGITKLSSQL